MKNVAMLLAASLVGVDATALYLRRDEPDPVHSRTMKCAARRQQREQAKRLARQRKGL